MKKIILTLSMLVVTPFLFGQDTEIRLMSDTGKPVDFIFFVADTVHHLEALKINDISFKSIGGAIKFDSRKCKDAKGWVVNAQFKDPLSSKLFYMPDSLSGNNRLEDFFGKKMKFTLTRK